MKNFKLKIVGLLSVLGLSPAFAQVDFTPLTSGVDFASTQSAVLTIGAAAVGLILAFKGVQYVYRAIKST